ncbi:MAG TPA: hypothetical protein DEH22_14505 [Chloroflexi bacterium]|nr:hypothetical protein [Chloroflexota bacterium]
MDSVATQQGGMPGWPVPDQPIPHHEPGQPARFGEDAIYQVSRLNAEGEAEIVDLTGLDALLANGTMSDPLKGNYRLVNLEKVMFSSYAYGTPNNFSVNTYAGTALDSIPGSGVNYGDYRFNAIAAGDLNGDLIDEQIAAWVDPGTRKITVEVRELPGALGQSTSAPAVVAHPNDKLDVLVQGYDDALWRLHFDGTNWSSWDTAGGLLLSSPAAVSRAAGELDVFALGFDNQVYRTQWISPTWGIWEPVYCGNDFSMIELSFPRPSIPGPAVVARGGDQLDLFRRGPDNTLRWCHSDDGATWGTWQNMGGMLASEPDAVALGDGRMQVYALGPDGALWYRTFSGGWGDWQYLETPSEIAGTAVPMLTSPGIGQVAVYLAGTGERVWSIQNNGSGGGTWSSISVDNVGGDPNVKFGAEVGVAAIPGGTYLFARMSDSSLQYISMGSDWVTPWASLTPRLNISTRSMINQETISASDTLAIENYIFDMTTGYFTGDGRQQLVLAHDDYDGFLRLEIYDVQDGFGLSKKAGITIGSVGWPRVAAGDVNGDGLDEIGLLYKDDSVGRIKLRVYQIQKGEDDNDPWTLQQISEDEFSPADWRFGGTLQIAAGNIVPDPDPRSAQDEFIVVSDWRQDVTILLSVRLSVNLHLYQYNNIQKVSTFTEKLVSSLDAYMPYTSWNEDYATGAGLAVGNVEANAGNYSYDEVIVTWPYDLTLEVYPNVRRSLRVYKYVTNNFVEIGAVDLNSGLLSESQYTFLDTLAVGDLDQDLEDEIVLACHECAGSGYGLKVYEFEYPNINRLKTAGLSFSTPPRAFNFALGDFTGESTRVGQPTYRAQNRVDSVLAELNMPPKHWDRIKKSDGTYQVIKIRTEECWTSAKDPKCTHTLHGTVNYDKSTTEIEIQRNWSVGTEIGLGEDKTAINTSLEYTYGQNFSKTTTTITKAAFSSDTTAGYDDQIIYYGNPYRIWEYPILSSNSTKPDGYLTVIFPDVTQSDIPDAAKGTYCSYGWYNPGHQPYNVWSYDPIGDIQFPDYDINNYIIDTINGGSDVAFQVYFENLVEVKTSSAQLHEFKGKLEFTAAKMFKAAVKGSYDWKEHTTDITQTSKETSFSAYLSELDTTDNFQTKAIAYWSTEGQLVIDFQTEPSSSATWQLYNKPDLAFILPWYGFPVEDLSDLPYPDGNNQGGPPCGTDKQYFSYDVVIDPPFISAGETVTVTATVRNFSDEPVNQVTTVRFYQGLPGTANSIGSCAIQPFERLDGPQQCAINWIVAGAGEQKIYAVIDPNNQLNEMHDENHIINNNMGYSVLQVGEASYIDEGATSSYSSVRYIQGKGLNIAFYAPQANLDATTRLDLRDNATRYPSVAGNPFEVVAIQGTDTRGWGTSISNFSLRPIVGDPPAVILIDYAGANLAGFRENLLMLYRKDAILGWQPANLDCGVDSLGAPLYPILRLPQDDLLAIPVCQTGLFALSDHQPEEQFSIFLPLVVR